jgi:hypothetical protein
MSRVDRLSARDISRFLQAALPHKYERPGSKDAATDHSRQAAVGGGRRAETRSATDVGARTPTPGPIHYFLEPAITPAHNAYESEIRGLDSYERWPR